MDGSEKTREELLDELGRLRELNRVLERKEAEFEAERIAFYESEKKFRQLFEMESDAIFLIDKETGAILEVNTAAALLYGYTREELLAKKNTDMSAEPLQTRQATQQELKVVPIRYHRKKDGTVFPVEITASHFIFRGRPVHIAAIRDITERKQAEAALKEQYAHLDVLKNIINRSGSLVFIWRVEPGKWPVEFVSENVADILGYSVDDFISGRVEWPSITHPDDVPRLEKEVAGYLERGVRNWSQEYRLITKLGEVKWFRDDNLAIEDSEGKISRIQAIIHDITERKRAEDALRESEGIFRQFMENSPVYVFLKDQNIRSIQLSRNYETMLGRPIGELLGKNMDDLFPSDLAKSMIADDMQILKEGKRVEVEEELNGRYYSTIKFPIDVEGKPRCLAGFTIDITDRKRAEDALRESEEKYRSVFNNFIDLYYQTDMQGLITNLSPSCSILSGWKPEELIGHQVLELYPDPEQRKALLEKLHQEGTVSDYEITLLHRDGRRLSVSVSSHLIRDERGNPKYVEGTLRDITDRKRAEEALRESEGKYRALVDNANETIIVAQDGLLKFVNRKAVELTGYSERELTTRPFPEFIHPDDRNFVVENYKKRLKDEPVPPRYTFRLLTNEGIVRWVEIGAVLIEWKGKPATLNFLSDVTERKEAEEKKDEFIRELQKALAEIKTLRGFISICAHCKKIRNDWGRWEQIESYIRDHTEAVFSHGVCPECMKKYYGKYMDDENEPSKD